MFKEKKPVPFHMRPVPKQIEDLKGEIDTLTQIQNSFVSKDEVRKLIKDSYKDENERVKTMLTDVLSVLALLKEKGTISQPELDEAIINGRSIR